MYHALLALLGAASCTLSGGLQLSDAGDTPLKELGVAVCIVGQLSRLEVTSKLQNVVAPLATATNVGIFVALEEDNNAVYNNHQLTKKDWCNDVSSPEELKTRFGKHYVGGNFTFHRVEPVDLVNFPRLYAQALPGRVQDRNAHVSNVMNQLRHMKECSDLIMAHEQSVGGRYRVILKIRDNSIAVRPLDPQELFRVNVAVRTKACCAWGGINDKSMLVPRDWMEQSLGAYYQVMRQAMSTNRSMLPNMLKPLANAVNTEQVEKEVLKFMGVQVEPMRFGRGLVSEDLLPFVDGRCAGDPETHWCIVSDEKDCWPQGEWTTQVHCKISDNGKQVAWRQDEGESQCSVSPYATTPHDIE